MKCPARRNWLSNLDGVVLRFAAGLELCFPFTQVNRSFSSRPLPDERRFEVVADVEVAARVDLRNRRLVRIDRQPDAQLLHARDVVGRREAARVHAVVSDTDFVERRVRQRLFHDPTMFCARDARLQRRIAIGQQVAFGVGRVVGEVIEEVAHAELILDWLSCADRLSRPSDCRPARSDAEPAGGRRQSPAA